MLQRLCLLFCLLALGGSSGAQQPTWQPSPEHVQVPLWPGPIPDARLSRGTETLRTDDRNLVAGKPYLYINSVQRPTLTVYAPRVNKSGAAVVVFPGGGYQILAIDLEGTEVCDWLTSRGITCILVKYRVPGEGRLPKSGAYPRSREALDDAQRALGLVRYHANDWHLDPHRIGVLGFSAGGHLVAAVSVHFDRRLYPAVDDADKQSCRPDFAIAIYPGHLSLSSDGPGLNPDIASHLSRRTPPTFLLQNEDDDVDGVNQSLAYYAALKHAGVPAEMHLYAEGGHAFGLRPTRLPASRWPRLVELWLSTLGIVSE